MPLPDKDYELKSIQGVEIFSAGNWNGDDYTENDLDEMVLAFNNTSQTSRPALKLGHDDKQKILQNDGYPAAGWIGRLYRKGKKLLADFVDIPEKVYELITRGAYRNVSSEIYWNADVNGMKYGKMLAGVALLGADMPAVSNLSDILAMYGIRLEKKIYTDAKNVPTIKSYSFNGGYKLMANEQDVSEMEKQRLKTAELEKQVNSLIASQKEQNHDFEMLKKNKQEADKRIVELERAGKETILEAELNEMVHTGVISPGMRNYAKELLGEEKKVYTINKKDLSKHDLLKELLSLHAEAVKLNKKEATLAMVEEPDEVNKLKGEVEKYAKENEVSFKEAYKQVFRGKLSNRAE